MTREEWIALAGGLRVAMEIEDSILNTGREFLPKCARDVVDNNDSEPALEYWAFLASQLTEEDDEIDDEG